MYSLLNNPKEPSRWRLRKNSGSAYCSSSSSLPDSVWPLLVWRKRERERIWAIAAASQEGQEIPVWLSQLRLANPQDPEQGSDPQTRFRESLIDELEVLRWCIDWLSRLERGEKVVVNLRPFEDVLTEFVSFDGH